MQNIQLTTQSIINVIPNPIVITDGMNMSMCNQSFLDFFKFNRLGEFLEKYNGVCDLFQEKEGYFSLTSINDKTLWTDYFLQSNKKEKVSILGKDGHTYIFHIKVEKLNESYIVVLTNITEREENISLKDIAYKDYLTQIYNRQMFDKLYIKEIENKKRHGEYLSLIILDIDHFKEVNDTYGHNVGDQVLIALTKIISENLRVNDIFARWGGEEFVILLPRTDKATAFKKAKELRQLIDEHQNKIPHFTVSFGVTQILDYDKDQSAFIRVDKALYQAKIKRNDVVKL